jgi:hypothetical protein
MLLTDFRGNRMERFSAPALPVGYVNHALFAFDRQLLLADLIGDLDWAYDLPTGTLSFGDRYRWQAEVLGTESQETGTWLWAWANATGNIPPERQAAALKLKALGERQGLQELTEPLVPLAHADGHTFAALAVGRGWGRAYYRGPYEGGAVWLLITDEQLQFPVAAPLQRILTVFPQAISVGDVPHHREALRGYLEHYGFEPEDRDGALVVRAAGEEVLRAEFDELGRLRTLKGTLGNEHTGAT